MPTRQKLITAPAAAAAFAVLAAQALAAPGAERPAQAGSAKPAERPAQKLVVLERPRERFERSVEVHETRLERLRERREAREPEFASPQSFGVSQATLDAIAGCESGGDPAAVSADGTYRGKYQFDTGTWASMGGSGDPAAAPEAEQDLRAAMLYARSGSSSWPICGA
jgi:soluble lytic murein transglycosylase-like protein